MNEGMRKVESLFFERFGDDASLENVVLVFILASPRVGSTLLYQLLVNCFRCFYFSNFINDYFAETPVIGAALDVSLNPHNQVRYESRYGKTAGPFGPSEGSLIFQNWFGGEHPSQTRSSKVLPRKAEHLVLTMKSIAGLTGQVIVTKNAWNCFRIGEFAGLFPGMHFIWLRRDVRSSAFSDLEARYKRGSSTVWNSATTANYEEIQKLPYWQQVVEQQYEYNKCIGEDLNGFAQGRYVELWYEPLCRNPEAEMAKLERYFDSWSLPIGRKQMEIPALKCSAGPGGLDEDYARIRDHVAAHSHRFQEYMFRSSD